LSDDFIARALVYFFIAAFVGGGGRGCGPRDVFVSVNDIVAHRPAFRTSVIPYSCYPKHCANKRKRIHNKWNEIVDMRNKFIDVPFRDKKHINDAAQTHEQQKIRIANFSLFSQPVNGQSYE